MTRANDKGLPRWALAAIVLLAIPTIITVLIGGENESQPLPSQESSPATSASQTRITEPAQEEAPAPVISETERVETESAASEPPESTGTCLAISARLLEAIDAGVKDVQGSNSVSQAAAYRAPERANVWFVAAEINGPGISSGEAIGVWASNFGVEGNDFGSLFSIDGIANAFSSWGSTEGTGFEISRFEKGVQEARDCLG
jgi:phage-related tail fiber protein